MQTRIRVGLGGLVLALAATLLVGVPSAAAQTDLDGVRIVADTVYRVLPDEGVVDVEVSYAVTNQIPNQRQGFQIIQTFLTSIPGAYPDAAVDLRAVGDDGTVLAMTRSSIEPDDESVAGSLFTVWDTDLGPNLFYQQTRRFTVSYRLPDGEARSENAWARVNPAYASFPVVARGDSGLSSVRVDFPPGYHVESFGSALERRSAFGGTVLSADAITDPFSFFALLVGSSEFGLNSRTVEVEGIDGALVISSWPGDDEWDAFVERGLVEGIPLLVDAIGVAWPVEGELEVIETIAPALAGYGGWFYEPGGSDGTDAAIDVGELLLFDLLGHEISHAWFNDEFSRMRWLNEGLAEYFGIVMATELEAPDIEEFDPVSTDSDGAIDLIDWRDPVFNAEEENPTEAFGYAASYQVISAIADEIGAEALEAALVLLFEGQNPYRDTLVDPGDERVDWRDLLDALELVAGSETAEDQLVTWVLGDDEEAQLEGRREARAAAATLDGLDPGWAVPTVIPALLADWDFADVEELVVEMTGILGDAQGLVDDAAARAIRIPSGPQDAYEAVGAASEGFGAARDGVAVQRAALDRVLAAYDRAQEPTAFFENVGLYGTDVDALVADAHIAFEAGDYDDAVAAAVQVDRLRDDAESLGQQRVAVVIGAVFGLLLFALLLAVLIRRRRRLRSSAAEAEDPVDEAEPEAHDDDDDAD